MKKIGIILLTVCMLTGLLTLSAFAKTKVDSASTWKDANIAYGSATFKDKVLFVTVNTVELSPRIVCDIYGNISH